ncbi:hypothetical protein Tco_0990632 [Tanacetum coccineum]|uniref:No apical meristem-associated C-terminal domain-containing protein n=1 Tax=Tanacetum coccineum TaxID=301880 RepID=A0ABQ5EXT7_9ASTR
MPHRINLMLLLLKHLVNYCFEYTQMRMESGESNAFHDRKSKGICFCGRIRRYLKLEDSDSISSLPIAEIFEQLALMGRSRLVSTADVSTASELGSTTGVKAKDKGKVIMQESEPPKKIKRRVQVQMSVDEELAKKVFMEEQAKFKAEHQQEKSDFEIALELQKQLDEREEVIAQAHNIYWSDHAG